MELEGAKNLTVTFGEGFMLTVQIQGCEYKLDCSWKVDEGRYYITVNDSSILVYGYTRLMQDVMNTGKLSLIKIPNGWQDVGMDVHDTNKKFYNYLLLDPRKLPDDFNEMRFKQFVEAIFYVGKGTQRFTNDKNWAIDTQRSFEHLYLKEDKENPLMINRVSAIRRSNEKVIGAHFFSCDDEDDSRTREACMIRAIGKDALVNKNHGSVRGRGAALTEDQQIHLGVHYLYLALDVFKTKATTIFQE